MSEWRISVIIGTVTIAVLLFAATVLAQNDTVFVDEPYLSGECSGEFTATIEGGYIQDIVLAEIECE